MPILISQQILDRICTELSNITESFTLISAYCKTPLVEYLDTFIDRPLVKNLIVRLKPEDILAGATDLELYPYCKEHGWSMFFRLDLHAKTYIFDNLRCVLGSANATSRGLSIGGVGNYEMAVLNEIDDSDRQQVRNLFRSSVRMTDALYADMKTAISSMESQHTPRASAKWPEEINQFFHPDFSLLFSEDFLQEVLTDIGDVGRNTLLQLGYLCGQDVNTCQQTDVVFHLRQRRCVGIYDVMESRNLMLHQKA